MDDRHQKEPEWERLEYVSAGIGGDLGADMWSIAKNMIAAAGHSARSTRIVADGGFDRMIRDIIRMASGHNGVSERLRELQSTDQIFGGWPTQDGRRPRILWADFTARGNLSFNILRGSFGEDADRNSEIVRGHMYLPRSVRECARISGGDWLFEQQTEDDARSRTEAALRGDLCRIVMHGWKRMIDEISSDHHLEIGHGLEMTRAEDGADRLAFVDLREKRRQDAVERRIRGEARREADARTLEAARTFLAAVTGDPAETARAIATTRGYGKTKTIARLLFAAGLSAAEDATVAGADERTRTISRLNGALDTALPGWRTRGA